MRTYTKSESGESQGGCVQGSVWKWSTGTGYTPFSTLHD